MCGILLGGYQTCKELVGVTWSSSDSEELVGVTWSVSVSVKNKVGGYLQRLWWLFFVGVSIEKGGLVNITDILYNISIKILFDYCHLPMAM